MAYNSYGAVPTSMVMAYDSYGPVPASVVMAYNSYGGDTKSGYERVPVPYDSRYRSFFTKIEENRNRKIRIKTARTMPSHQTIV